MKQTISAVLSVALFLALIAVLSFGLVRKRHYDNELAATRARISDAERKLGDCEKTRDGTEKVAAETQANLQTLRSQNADQEKQLTSFKELTEKFRKMIDSGKLQVTIRHGRMIVKLPAGVLFATGSADLSKGGRDAIDEVAEVLKQYPDRRFMVAGHTDSIPIGPPSAFKNNLELSAMRAVNVSRQLMHEGLSPARLVAAGYSEYEPVKSNSTEAGRQENRRIEIELLPRIREVETPSTEAGNTHASNQPAAQDSVKN